MTQPGDGGSGSANSGDSGGGNQQQGGVSLFTQEQVNAIAANEKRGAVNGLFKEIGLEKPLTAEELKEALTHAGEFRKLQEGQQSDVERLTGEVNKYKPLAETRDTQLTQARVAADMGLKPRYWKYVEGSSEEDIKASVQEILQDVRGGGDGSGDGEQGSDQQQGGGKRPAPTPQQGRGGGTPPAKTMSAGAEAYRAKHKKE